MRTTRTIRRTTKPWSAAGAALALLGALALAPAPVEVQTDVVRLSGDRVAVWNLAGTVTVVPGAGPDVVVRVDRGGADADRLTLDAGPVGGREALRVRYPSDRVRYDAMGPRSRMTVQVRDDGTFGDGRRVDVTGGGDGLRAWADLRVEVPAGRDVAVHVAVGDVEVRDVRGTVAVDTHSGDVALVGVTGPVRVDTGSGEVSARGVAGRLEIDTGSGEVVLRDVTGDRVVVDTGSGAVTGGGLDVGMLVVDTGSGGVELAEVRSADVRIDTGSGGVHVTLPPSVGAELEVDTGSGGIEIDFPLEVRVMERQKVRGRIGDGAGRIRIDTGSGSVRITRR